MKKTMILTILAGLLIATPVFAITYHNAKEVKDATWVISNGDKPTRVYKIEDGDTDCYVARTDSQIPSSSISCVKDSE